MCAPSSSLSPPTANAAQPTYRLLYRGAMSLPDSTILLDGLTFALRIDASSSVNAAAAASDMLLQNPLALALESMRGRPSLRFMGTVDMENPGKGLWVDDSGSVIACVLSAFVEYYSH